MKKIFTAILVFTLIFLAACGSAVTGSKPSAAPAAVKQISPEAAKARLDSGDALVLLDVRTAAEYAEAHIGGAVLLPNEEIGSADPALLPVKDAEIIIYCRSGNRSAQAADKLVKLGYTNVSDLGGIKDWPYDTVKGEWSAKTGAFSSFRASTIEGRIVDESIFAGHKLTMINVWATYCGPCLNEMPDLGKLAAANSANGVQIIGIAADTQNRDGSSSQSQIELARQLVSKTGAAYTHLLPSADLMSAGLSGVSAVPTTFFADEKGNLVGKVYEGSRSGEKWQAIIDELLAGQGA